MIKVVTVLSFLLLTSCSVQQVNKVCDVVIIKAKIERDCH